MSKIKEKILVFYSWSDLWSMGKGKGSPDFSLSMEALAESFSQVTVVYPAGGNDLHGLPDNIERKPFRVLFRSEILKKFGELNIFLKVFLYPLFWVARLVAHLYFNVSALIKAFNISEKFDLVGCYGAQSITAARVYSWYCGIPLVVRLFGLALGIKGYSLVQRLIHFDESIALGSDAWGWIITNDGSCGDLAAERFNIPEEQLFFPLCAVERKQLCDSFNREEFCEKYGIKPDSRIVIRVCRLWEQQRVDRMIECIPDFTRDGKPVVGLIVGEGTEQKNLENLAERLGKKIVFAGAKSREELEEIYRAADLYVATSDRTNLSNSVLEAFVYGVPVVALDKGGTSALIKDNRNGFLVRDNNLELLEEKIQDILSDSGLYDRIVREILITANEMIPDFAKRKADEAKSFMAAVGKEPQGI